MSFYKNNFFDFSQRCTIRTISKTKTYIHGEIFDGGSIDCGGLKSDRPLVLHNRLSPANSGLMIDIISFIKNFFIIKAAPALHLVCNKRPEDNSMARAWATNCKVSGGKIISFVLHIFLLLTAKR